MKDKRVVIDANVIVSASFNGVSLQALLVAFDKYRVYVSKEIVEEFIMLPDILFKKHKISEKQYGELKKSLKFIFEHAISVEILNSVDLCRDKTDNKYLSLCKQIDADYLLTGDKDLLSIPEKLLRNVNIRARIITPGAFIQFGRVLKL